jgi:hypothetical protein
MTLTFGEKKTIKERAASVESRLGSTTKGTAEAAKPGKWKIKKLKLGDGGKSFEVEAKKKF